MAQGTSKSELVLAGQRGAALHLSTLGRIVRAHVLRAARLFRKRPHWLKTGEAHSRQIRNRHEIYTEDIGPIGLKNIEILLDRRKERLPGSTLYVDLLGRDRGVPEASLKIDIMTKDEEAVLELAAEIRRSNGQSWVGVYVTAGNFIEISGPKEPITELRDHSTSNNSEDSRAAEVEHAASDLESTPRI
jgi:hypothetical protein